MSQDLRPLPAQFAGREAQGLPERASLGQFLLGDMRNFVYVLADRKLGQAWVVDPHRELEPLLASLKSQELQLQGVLLTHTHHDHVGGVEKALAGRPEARVYVHALDLHRIQSEGYASRVEAVSDGQVLQLGSWAVEVLHLPGHSPGELAFRIREGEEVLLLTGDTLFLNDCGATHFAGGSDEAMFESLARIRAMEPNTLILPGHQYTRACAARLGELMQKLPSLQVRSVEELRAIP